SGSGAVNVLLRNVWKLADAGLELRELPKQRAIELRSDRVFLDPPVAEAILKAVPQAQGVLTYFVNEIRKGERATPYSMVAAIEMGKPRLTSAATGAAVAALGERGPVAVEMRDDQITINTWLAEDLQAKVGDTITLAYFVVGQGRALEERTTEFRVK